MSVVNVSVASYVTNGATTTSTITVPSVSSGHDLYVMAASRGHTATDPVMTCVDTDSGGNTWSLETTVADRRAYLWHKKATSATSGKVVTLAGAIASTCGGLAAFSGASTGGDPTTNVTQQTNTLGVETHAGFTPDNADSMICIAVYNLTNDTGIEVSNMQGATLGSMTSLFDHSSFGGSDCYMSLWAKASQGTAATGNFTWDQTDSGTRTIAWAIKPFVASSTTQSVSTSTGFNPVYTYANAGTYTVTLTVTDNDGLSNSTSKPVTVT